MLAPCEQEPNQNPRRPALLASPIVQLGIALACALLIGWLTHDPLIGVHGFFSVLGVFEGGAWWAGQRRSDCRGGRR